uniref:5-oxoprolinase n=1 Tax=Strigamia maritima TaxID=126957 RepID=T1J869_STRMM
MAKMSERKGSSILYLPDDTSKFYFAIDRGGTFTDIYARCPGNKIRVMKLLSVDPANYDDAPREGIRRILEEETGVKMSPDKPIDVSSVYWIRMGTTVATNALLERKGEPIALVITKGLRDLLYIGNQARPRIFDIEIVCPEVLYSDIIEVEERVILENHKCCLKKEHLQISTGSTGERVVIAAELNKNKLREDLARVYNKGIKSLAVVLMHSYTFRDHELVVGSIAQSMGFTHISLSHQVMPMVRIVPRGFTACADAYLTPHIKRYVDGFASGFDMRLKGVNVLFMQSDGGLTHMDSFSGSRAILSGPAGGVVGYALTTYEKETTLPVIGFDMGGTSTDVSRYAGHFEHVFESTTAGVTIQAPQLDVNTVAAGGGSMLFFRSGLFVVGPESAGAHPGPVCYRKGGPLTVTDANLFLGRLIPDYFPKIFGPHENLALDEVATAEAFRELSVQVNEFLMTQNSKQMSSHDIAMGFLQVANEAMCRPIRALTQGKGYDTSRHCLACFGGAGGQHACAIARTLGMTSVFIHRYAGILSAYGMALADVVHEAQEPCAKPYTRNNFTYLDNRLTKLTEECVEHLEKEGFESHEIRTEQFLHLRYDKTDCALMCSADGFAANDKSCRYGDFQTSFLQKYQQEFGFVIGNREILVDDIRVRGYGKSEIYSEPHVREAHGEAPIEREVSCYFEKGLLPTRIHKLSKLDAGHTIQGPAIIIDEFNTILLEPDCKATMTRRGDIKITVGSETPKRVGIKLDAIQLSIFSHRFMSIAEQMGRILQRTSISTNIKERLDFSCALFGPDGGLVSNAPHIPVHLGAMQETVQYQLKNMPEIIRDGDVILSNHPSAGGSHLPDLTVITPVFYKTLPTPVFFVACRGHHADIGGITPGSMPPHSKTLAEEGACFMSFKVVNSGIFQEEGKNKNAIFEKLSNEIKWPILNIALTEKLKAPGKIPGNSGTRNLQDNISDLRAQVAANQKGINLVRELIDFYSLEVVQAYMAHIQNNAEIAVQDLLRQVGKKALSVNRFAQLNAEDFMDDGTPIRLKVDIDVGKGTAVFDFTGTGYEVYGNCNAPRAITISALIYCLRCMVGYDVPLNQGCLKPIIVIIPKGSILDPSETAAVVGGNVLTSQRIVDVVFKAFSVCAASQGCMNNITFGDEDTGYYETVAGGAGAGPHWHGRSGVHTHMTNTRITDPEILERRYPVIIKQFQLTPNTGGSGKYNGGNGIIRKLLFRKRLTLSVLTERRAFAPYGLN